VKIIIYDIEVYGGFFLFCGLNPESGEMHSFRLSKTVNEIDGMLRFLENHKEFYFVGYNNVRYDSQVVEYIVRNNSSWYDLPNEKILEKIKRFSNDVIDDQDYESFPPFREWQISFKQIDLFKIHHFDNKNRAASLKWIAFMMDMEDIEELPYDHFLVDLNDEQTANIEKYCWNDVKVTHRFYLYTIGETTSDFYKGKNKIQDRLDIIDELGFPAQTLNFSDVKIGDEINKRGYCNIKGIDEKQLYEIRKRRGLTRKLTFGDCIPSYVTFESPELKKFLDKVAPIRVKMSSAKAPQRFQIKFRGNTYVVARGGIHTAEKARIIIPQEDEILRDADAGSQHPTAIVKRGLFPDHLGPEWLINYKKTIDKRMVYKPLAEENPKYKGLSDTYKLALNGGGFGKTIDATNWQYGPEVGFGCTIGNQFEILMLAERMELNGIKVLSANTDGIVCLFKKRQEEKYKEVCKWWEETVGNTEMGKLEYSDFKILAQESINHYVAVKTNGKLKIKGRFATECEVNKNNTKDLGRIERRAIVEYFAHGTPIEETIRNSRNIFEFMIGVKSSKDYHYETIGTETLVYKRIIRFYVSKEGVKLLKIKNEDSDAPGAAMSRIVDGYYVTIMNHKVDMPWEDYGIDYSYYIDKAKEIVSLIEGKALGPKNQLSLF